MISGLSVFSASVVRWVDGGGDCRRLNHEWRERRRKTRKGVSQFSCPFVNFVVQIDALVYELYGLTEEEIGVIESLNR